MELLCLICSRKKRSCRWCLLVFQVQDDILDITGDAAKTGRQSGSDLNNNKTTFVSVHGLQGAQQRLDDLYQTAIDALEPLGTRGEQLKALAEFVVNRDH